jgi:hypothetical protein
MGAAQIGGVMRLVQDVVGTTTVMSEGVALTRHCCLCV